MPSGSLGRRLPTDWKHVERYPLRALAATTPKVVEVEFPISRAWRRFYDQGSEGACVGFSCCMAKTVLDRHRYNASDLYLRAQLRDEWPTTPPDEGTSVRAGGDALIEGPRRVRLLRGGMRTYEIRQEDTIVAYRWATSVDEVRSAFAQGAPVVLGCNWYSGFDMPEYRGRGKGYWLLPEATGVVRGGHAIAILACSDERQAVRFPNSWGLAYPETWMPYSLLEQLLAQDGECMVMTDR